MKVTKEGYFEAAHMLSNYSGRCGNLHGHSYRYCIAVHIPTGAMVSDMVLDFNDIKRVVDRYDHAIIFAGAGARDTSEQGLVDWAEKYDKRRIYMPNGQRPTCENMAIDIAESVIYCCRDTVGCDEHDIHVVVDLWETHSGHASHSCWGDE